MTNRRRPVQSYYNYNNLKVCFLSIRFDVGGGPAARFAPSASRRPGFKTAVQHGKTIRKSRTVVFLFFSLPFRNKLGHVSPETFQRHEYGPRTHAVVYFYFGTGPKSN